MAPEASIVAPGTRAGSALEAWRLAWPTVVGNIAVTLMWMADTIMLGRVGKVELAAGGYGGVLVWTLTTFWVGLATTVNSFVAQARGRDDPDECARFAWQGVWVGAAAGAVLGLAAWRFADVVALADLAPDVARECARYGRGRLPGTLFVVGSFALQSFYRGIGDVRTPMRVALASNALNVLLDWLLIFGPGPFPRWTTFGAGLATALSNAFGFAVLLALLLGPRVARAYPTRRAWRPSPRDLLRLLRVGAPTGLQFMGDMVAFSAFLAIVGRLGTDALAASQVAVQVLSFSFMPASGVARAATTLVGQYLGAGRPDLAARSGWTTVRLNLAYAVAVGATLLLLDERLFRVFNEDPAMLAVGAAILPALAAFQVLDALQMAAAGALQGAGDTAVPMAVFLGSSYAVFLPLAWLATGPLGLGAPGGWWAGVLHFGLVASVLLLRWAGGRWRERRI